ncbi:GNAT family N-acetyltransferase [Kouleothrix sp.]|uniref:GNAT family N-acetyltransferase n=1 Tax=Kouleothrix sp. TaxID=2779161 RepID=UPI003919279B
MTTHLLSNPAYRRDMGGGLVLRWSGARDAERIAALYAEVFRRAKDDPPNLLMAAWTRELMSGRHPLIGAGDFALVENTRDGTIAASTCLIRQTWSYEGIPLAVGRPEIVGTRDGYRERGLVRAIFELIHARGAADGQLAQGITGIPFYYRQFGYEYAADLGGERYIYFSAIPRLAEGQAEPFVLRDATPADLPRVLALYDQDRQRAPVSTQLDVEYLRWVLEGQSAEAAEGWRTQLIAGAADAAAVGYVLTHRRRWGDALPVLALGFAPGVPLPAALPSVLRALMAQAPGAFAPRPNTPPPARLSLVLGREHPAYAALDPMLAATYEAPYAWYVRVPDLPAFVRHVAPALERRLAGSIMAGYSGELRLDFYRGGLRLAFEQGRLRAAEPWNARAVAWGPKPNGGFPPLVFLQLLFGHRSLSELRYAFPDVWAEEEARPALEALFPSRPAWVLPLD